MSVVAYNQPRNLTQRGMDMTSHQGHMSAQHVDPMTYLYNLEHEMEMSERRTASMMKDLTERLYTLEDKVEKVGGRFETINRQLEKAVIALAQRVNSIEGGGAR